jgi:hypothetical protein
MEKRKNLSEKFRELKKEKERFINRNLLPVV